MLTSSCHSPYFMLKGPKSYSRKQNKNLNSAYHVFTSTAQHGDSSPLHSLPSETLTHITSFLDPPSLRSLSLSCRKFQEHVNEDNTWHRAFFYQFFGLSPVDTLDGFRPLTFRSTAKTWRLEFIRRNVIRRRASLFTDASIAYNFRIVPQTLVTLQKRSHIARPPSRPHICDPRYA